MERTITITTFPATTRPETDPLIREFSPEVTEAREQVSVSPLLLLTEPGIIELQAKLAGAARMLLECVAGEGHRAQSLTVIVKLAGDTTPDADSTSPQCTTPGLHQVVSRVASALESYPYPDGGRSLKLAGELRAALASAHPVEEGR